MPKRTPQLRVVAGSAGGLRLQTPKRVELRPTQDRIKQVIYSSLGEAVVGAQVLDLYAGTGALGIEALSRGAASCTFVEKTAEGVATIRENLHHCRLEGQVLKQDVSRFLAAGPRAGQAYDLILADPPYEKVKGCLLGHELLTSIQPWLSPRGRFVWEHYSGQVWPADTESELEQMGWKLIRHRNYGETGLSFLSKLEEKLSASANGSSLL